MSTIELPSGENILLVALREIQEGQAHAPGELMADYERYFQAPAPVPAFANQPQTFERFSLVDPTVLTTVQSATAPP